MDVSSMLSGNAHDSTGANEAKRQNHQYSTRHTQSGQEPQYSTKLYGSTTHRSIKISNGVCTGPGHARGSPAKKDQKHVVFQLIDDKDPRIQARLPMRVMISPHDTTDSIITTVKNFYGLYEYGVSFENQAGISIIAAFDNFDNDMTIHVRTISQPTARNSEHARDSVSPKRPSLGAPIEMRPPTHHSTHSPSRSAARSAGFRSVSPHSELERRSTSAAPGGKPRVHRARSRDPTNMMDADGYSSGDNGSVASSRRSKAEEIKAEITVDNIVEGGRRKRAFESSELPLFVPPQVPMSASISSISPQRRSGPHAASPYAFPIQQTFSYTQPLPSPQSFSHGSSGMQPPFPTNPYQNGAQQGNRQLRGSRVGGAGYSSQRYSNGVLPTPDPTIGSVISDEDVALQLMRLGDPAVFSHGRTSTSTVDDAFSGKADAASSDDEGDDEEELYDEEDEEDGDLPTRRYSDAGPQRKKQRMQNDLPSDITSGDEYEDHRDGTFASNGVHRHDGDRRIGKPKNKMGGGSVSTKPGRPQPLSTKPKKSSFGCAKVPMSPASLPSQSRKASISSAYNFQHHLAADEEDLSSKPRCQRCRKSKKGCDRQRPCGRCKDAGLTADDCVSEDEGNGRKGRYGRHMGVTIKKSEESLVAISPASPYQGNTVSPESAFLAPALPDKNKKRKR